MKRAYSFAVLALLTVSAMGLFTNCCKDKDDTDVEKDDTDVVNVTGVSIKDKDGSTITRISLFTNNTCQIYANIQPADATDKTVTFSSENDNIATVSLTGVVKAVTTKPDSTYIVATTKDGNNIAKLKVVVKPAQAVDLGLTSGTLWADRNVGATDEKGIGKWFYWADLTQPDENKFTKEEYNSLMNNVVITTDIAHTEYDMATQNWGEDWQLPSKDQFQELLDECNWVLESGGYKVISKSDETKSIFIPYSYSCDGRGLINEDYTKHKYASYWSSTPQDETKINYLYFNQFYDLQVNNPQYGASVPYAGFTVRPVQPASAK